MPEPVDAWKNIELYLLRVRRGLRRLPEGEVAEILRELRSHIQERASSSGLPTEASVRAALEALGDPEDLSRMYVTENLVGRAVASRSPWLILRGISRWAGMSFWGFAVFMAALAGYGMGIALFLCAILKPFFPQHVGLWWRSNPLLVDAGALWPIPAGARELLGWWLIPVSLVVGLIFLWLTHRFSLLCIRRFRRLRLIPV